MNRRPRLPGLLPAVFVGMLLATALLQVPLVLADGPYIGAQWFSPRQGDADVAEGDSFNHWVTTTNVRYGARAGAICDFLDSTYGTIVGFDITDCADEPCWEDQNNMNATGSVVSSFPIEYVDMDDDNGDGVWEEFEVGLDFCDEDFPVSGFLNANFVRTGGDSGGRYELNSHYSVFCFTGECQTWAYEPLDTNLTYGPAIICGPGIPCLYNLDGRFVSRSPRVSPLQQTVTPERISEAVFDTREMRRTGQNVLFNGIEVLSRSIDNERYVVYDSPRTTLQDIAALRIDNERLWEAVLMEAPNAQLGFVVTFNHPLSIQEAEEIMASADLDETPLSEFRGVTEGGKRLYIMARGRTFPRDVLDYASQEYQLSSDGGGITSVRATAPASGELLSRLMNSPDVLAVDLMASGLNVLAATANDSFTVVVDPPRSLYSDRLFGSEGSD